MIKNSDTYNDELDITDIDDTNSYKKLNIAYENKRTISNEKIRFIIMTSLLILFAVTFIGYTFVEMPKLIHEYSSSIDSENIVYMGESLKIDIHNTRDGKNQKLFNYIEPTNEYLFYVLKNNLSGSNVSTHIVPIMEGEGALEVFSNLSSTKNKKEDAVTSERTNITVCPSFNSDLLISSQLSVVKGTTYQLNADFGLGNCSTDIIYKSNNNKIMTVSDSGLVKGINTGKTELVVSKFDKTFIVPITITDSKKPVTDLNIDHSKVQLMPGERFRLNINQLPSNSTSINVVCLSSNNEVATVTNSGLITGISPGEAAITVSYGNIKKTVTVVVNDVGLKQKPASDISVKKENLTIKKDSSYKIFTLVTPDEAINSLNNWSSADDNIAVVDYNGVIYAKNVGTTQITVKNGNIIKVIKVNVIE